MRNLSLTRKNGPVDAGLMRFMRPASNLSMCSFIFSQENPHMQKDTNHINSIDPQRFTVNFKTVHGNFIMVFVDFKKFSVSTKEWISIKKNKSFNEVQVEFVWNAKSKSFDLADHWSGDNIRSFNLAFNKQRRREANEVYKRIVYKEMLPVVNDVARLMVDLRRQAAINTSNKEIESLRAQVTWEENRLQDYRRRLNEAVAEQINQMAELSKQEDEENSSAS